MVLTAQLLINIINSSNNNNNNNDNNNNSNNNNNLNDNSMVTITTQNMNSRKRRAAGMRRVEGERKVVRASTRARLGWCGRRLECEDQARLNPLERQYRNFLATEIRRQTAEVEERVRANLDNICSASVVVVCSDFF